MFRVQGERFHLQPGVVSNDKLQKAILAGFGFTVVDIWVDQLNAATRFVVEAALRGQTMRAPR